MPKAEGSLMYGGFAVQSNEETGSTATRDASFTKKANWSMTERYLSYPRAHD